MGARQAVRGQHAGVGEGLGQVFGDRQGVPDAGAFVIEARHQHRRRQQQKFGAVGFDGNRPFLDLVVCRYQPLAIDGEHLSETVALDSMRLGADRTVRLTKGANGINVRVSGPDNTNQMWVTVQQADPAITDLWVAHMEKEKGIKALPTIGDGRQSGTSESPSILNASPEAAAGGNLAILRTNDRVRFDLKRRRLDVLIPSEELAARRAELQRDPPPIPPSQTPWQEIERADVVVRLVDVRAGLTEADAAIDARLPAGVERITVFNKVDLLGRQPERTEDAAGVSLYLSAKADQGVELLRAELLRVAGWHRHGEDVILARERHLIALREALARVEAALDARHALELMAEELRLAQEAVNEITGEFTPDDLLGVIFSRFCIGK